MATTSTELNPIAQIEQLHQRLEKAREIVKQGKVHPVLNLDNHYFVQSSTGNGGYLVNGSRNCPDAQDRSELHRGFCKHRLATVIYKQNPEPLADPDPNRGRPKTRQRRVKGNGEASNGDEHIITPEERELHEREIEVLFPKS